MNTLVIYDNEGYLISSISGDYLRLPVGVPYILTEIPEGKRIKIVDGICVDFSGEEASLMLEDIPKTEIEELRDYIDELEIAMIDLASMIIPNGDDE